MFGSFFSMVFSFLPTLYREVSDYFKNKRKLILTVTADGNARGGKKRQKWITLQNLSGSTIVLKEVIGNKYVKPDNIMADSQIASNDFLDIYFQSKVGFSKKFCLRIKVWADSTRTSTVTVRGNGVRPIIK